MVSYWAQSQRPVSRKYSSRIAEIVGQVHSQRQGRERESYLSMIRGIESESARAMMLAMLAAEIEIRVQAVAILARNGTRESKDAR